MHPQQALAGEVSWPPAPNGWSSRTHRHCRSLRPSINLKSLEALRRLQWGLKEELGSYLKDPVLIQAGGEPMSWRFGQASGPPWRSRRST